MRYFACRSAPAARFARSSASGDQAGHTNKRPAEPRCAHALIRRVVESARRVEAQLVVVRRIRGRDHPFSVEIDSAPGEETVATTSSSRRSTAGIAWYGNMSPGCILPNWSVTMSARIARATTRASARPALLQRISKSVSDVAESGSVHTTSHTHKPYKNGSLASILSWPVTGKINPRFLDISFLRSWHVGNGSDLRCDISDVFSDAKPTL